MTSKTLWFGLVLAVVAGLVNAADKPDDKASSPAATMTHAPSVQVIAYYFHGAVRCETCQKIERQAHKAIKDKFKVELATKRLVFQSVNYDLPENGHFLQDYKLPCPSLVLVRRQAGKDEKWKLLGETWQLVEDATKFNRYVTDAVSELLPTAK